MVLVTSSSKGHNSPLEQNNALLELVSNLLSKSLTAPQTAPKPTWVKRQGICDYLDISEGLVRRLLENNVVEGYTVPYSTAVRYKTADLDKAMEANITQRKRV